MKKFIIAAVLALICFAGDAQQKKFIDLVGRWEFIGEQNSGASLEIIDSTNIILSYNGEKKKINNYKIDFSRSPIWFDFSTEDSTSTLSIKSILEIMNEGLIKWQLFIDEERPNYFSSSKGELLFLKKSVANTNAIAANNQ